MELVFEIQASDFGEEAKESGIPLVVEFWKSTCGYCKKFRPIYEQLPKVFGDKVKFLKMDMLKDLNNLRLAESFGVEETPTLKIYCNGQEIGEIIGYMSLNEVVSEIEEILKRDDLCHPHK